MEPREISVSDAARRLAGEIGRVIAPREITLLFYDRVLPDDLAPIRCGRRRIDPSTLPTIASALERKRETHNGRPLS
jgi:hypothetical protein